MPEIVCAMRSIALQQPLLDTSTIGKGMIMEKSANGDNGKGSPEDGQELQQKGGKKAQGKGKTAQGKSKGTGKGKGYGKGKGKGAKMDAGYQQQGWAMLPPPRSWNTLPQQDWAMMPTPISRSWSAPAAPPTWTWPPH